MRILRDKTLQKMLKEAYERGLGIRKELYAKAAGGVLAGYDIDRDLLEIQRRSVKNGR